MEKVKNKFYYIEQYHKETTKRSINLMHANKNTPIKDILDNAAKSVRDMKDPEKTPGFYFIHHEDNPLAQWMKDLPFEVPATENEKKITKILQEIKK